MGFFEDNHEVQIGSTNVSVTGTTGPVHATWTLRFDGTPVDSAKAAGQFTLRGELPDSTVVKATVFQSLIGPTKIVIEHQDEELARFSGFVA